MQHYDREHDCEGSDGPNPAWIDVSHRARVKRLNLIANRNAWQLAWLADDAWLTY
jgi:hypothetical protein